MLIILVFNLISTAEKLYSHLSRFLTAPSSRSNSTLSELNAVRFILYFFIACVRLQFQLTDGGKKGARKWHLVVLPTTTFPGGRILHPSNQMGKILIQVVAELRDPNRKNTLQRKRSRAVSNCESKKDELLRNIQNESDDEIIDQMSEQYGQLKANKSQN